VFVKSSQPYAEFTGGRDVERAQHHEDESPPLCIGQVAVLVAGDEEITQDEFRALSAAIAYHNEGLVQDAPAPPARPTREDRAAELAAIFEELEPDLEAALHIIARHIGLEE